MKVLRDTKPVSLSVTVGELNLEAEAGTPDEEESLAEETAGFGITLDDVTADVARRLQLPRATQGALVADIDPGGAAARAGLRRFDVLTRINGEAVTSAADASRKMQAISSGRLARVLVVRGGQELFLSIRKE
jgi:serine protease Do